MLLALVLAGCVPDAERESTSAAPATGGAGFVSGDGTITTVAAAERKDAPRITGTDLDGRPLDTASYADKVLVVNVWGSWCPPCRREAPVLNKVARATQDRGVQFVGIAVREEATASKAFTDKLDVPYPSISDPSSQQLLGFSNTLPAMAVPTTYIIDRDGRVAARILDEVEESTLTGLVDDVLAEAPGE
ncbi:TlpA family protein disulfide reductase [Solicola sp. PLA-1-18]|uniref:TlpA family protein disulfide reductase n=1 Tax=Solicola sp. PLA-1-18 TaxID=3380532 RepID=UPI003B7F6FFE